LEEYGKVEQMPQLEGKRMIMFIAPKKVVKKATSAEDMPEEDVPVKRQPQQKAKKEYTGPKVEGETFDD
jgi:translation initiation factor IF-3